ncbi:MAG: dienelactone hydrolase family protein [Firmicutes bacterium]|nr:dienelactone hydrolase family protein [Bacillota bacterium]
MIAIHDAFDPAEHLHDVARRFANRGYTGLAPTLYSRIGTPHLGNA